MDKREVERLINSLVADLYEGLATMDESGLAVKTIDRAYTTAERLQEELKR